MFFARFVPITVKTSYITFTMWTASHFLTVPAMPYVTNIMFMRTQWVSYVCSCSLLLPDCMIPMAVLAFVVLRVKSRSRPWCWSDIWK